MLATFTNTDVIIYIKQIEPQIKGPQDSSTGIWTVDQRKEPHVILNYIKQLKFDRDPSITPVTTSKHISNVGIYCKKTLQLAKFYLQIFIQSFYIKINKSYQFWTLCNLA